MQVEENEIVLAKNNMLKIMYPESWQEMLEFSEGVVKYVKTLDESTIKELANLGESKPSGKLVEDLKEGLTKSYKQPVIVENEEE
jgi:soluble cytochrome b562